MSWVISKKGDYNDIKSFLIKNEWQHIQAASLFTDHYPSKFEVITLLKRVNNSITSLICLTHRGMIYPIFNRYDLYNPEDKDELIRLFARINIRIHGVIGLKDDVEFLDSIIFRRIRGKIDYLLMHRESMDLFPITDTGLYRATSKDLSSLLPLEYEYQCEEVLLNAKDLNKQATKENFRQKLQTNANYMYKIEDTVVSKASTSQQSFYYTLVGGVFTWKHLRNRGYSTTLLKFLINDQNREGYKSALFVKTENQAAIHIYKKLGFIESLPYKIHYYFL